MEELVRMLNISFTRASGVVFIQILECVCESLFRARKHGPGQNAFSLVLDSKSRTLTSLCTFLSHYPLALEL